MTQSEQASKLLRGAGTSFVNGSPLIAALLAPAATLYDIPALSQYWYRLDTQPVPDPRASLIISALSLACSVAANALLIIRFTVRLPQTWRRATMVSTVGWILKTALSVSNVIVFGATKRNGPGFSYAEGFWCAIMSTILSGLVALLLIINLFSMVVLRHQSAPGQMHLDGRVFLLSELTLFGLIALQALVFCKIEGWLYVDALYFTVVTFLTIGFGDFSPSTVAGQIILFPFALAGFALLSNQVALIASVSSQRTARYRQELHAIESSSATLQHSYNKEDDTPLLEAEACRLRHLDSKQRGLQGMVDLAISISVLCVFWIVSAAIYSSTEGWSYGTALYFSYVFFFTIGYGSPSPTTAAGKTVFIFWALLAVPIMTNFVVVALQTIVSQIARFLTNRTREKTEEWRSKLDEYFLPHADLVVQAKEKVEALRKHVEQSDCDSCKASTGKEDLIVISRADLLAALQESLLLEAEARSIMVDQMEPGSAPWLLLKADKNVQERHLAKMHEKHESKKIDRAAADSSLIQRVADYRQRYARWLVLGGRLMKLDGTELSTWERRHPETHRDNDGVGNGATELSSNDSSDAKLGKGR